MKCWFSFILFLFSYALHADVIYEKLDEKDFFDKPLVKISITGEIKIGDYEDLKKYLNEVNLNNYRVKEDSIFLNSEGGNMQEARDMGHLIRKHHIATKINHDDQCVSACSLIFIAGSCRMAEGYIGLHRSVVDTKFVNYEELSRFYAYSENEVKKYIDKMGAHNLYKDIIYNTPNWDVWWLSDLQKQAYGLMVTQHKESYYFQEVVSRKISAPKQFLLDDVYNIKIDKEDALSWYEEKILKKDPLMQHPSCTEQMFLHLLEKYPIGTDKWDEEFQLYDSFQGYSRIGPNDKFDFYYQSDIPLSDGVSHFWHIEYFKKGAKTITYREETILSEPTEWEKGDDLLTIDMDGKRASRTITVDNTGTIFNGWGLDPKKDPSGPMTVNIYIDDKLVKTFNYNIVNKLNTDR